MTTEYSPAPASLVPLFSDDDLIIIDKPAELLSVPGRGPEKADSALSRLQAIFPEVHVVHRLDMSTSGVMVFARNKTTLSALHRQFERRQTDKIYEAVVSGKLAPSGGAVNLPLRCDWPNRPKQMVCYEHGKKSLTRWKTSDDQNIADATRINLFPVTGRSHQLRVHCDSIGHPILGDNLYGTEESQNASPRLLLHARDLSFRHPASEEMLTFTAPVPF